MVSLEDFCQQQKRMLAVEWDAETAATEELLRTLTDAELQSKGVVLLNMTLGSISVSLFDKTMVTMQPRRVGNTTGGGLVLPTHGISSGDIVGIFDGSFLEKPVSSGVVHRVTQFELDILVDDDKSALALSDGVKYKVAQMGSRVTHNRLCRTVDKLEKSAHAFIDVMFGERVLETPSISIGEDGCEPRRITGPLQCLNPPQQTAVMAALQSELVTLIHGPPGTGKTRTLSVIIFELVRRFPSIKILACAPSNVGVDNLVSAVASIGCPAEGVKVPMVRLGHPSRIDSALVERFSLDALVKQGDFAESCGDIRKEINALLASPSRSGKFREIRELRKDLKTRESKSIQQVFSSVNVVFSTCTGAFDIMKKLNVSDPSTRFDVCIVDECAQALEIAAWIPILESRKIIVAGDHMQLPPTVKSDQQPLKLSLFERAVQSRKCPSYLLSVQYRMNARIMGWSNKQFYDNQLQAHSSVAEWTLHCTEKKFAGIVDVTSVIESPFVFCDTTGVDSMSETDYGLSKSNPGEVHVIKQYLKNFNFLDKKISVSVISPYLAQTELLRLALEECPNIRIATVDSYQGQESDVVVISLVRANRHGEIGFLADYRRLNVAVTRARKHVFIVGNGETISRDTVMRSLVEYGLSEGVTISAQTFVGDDFCIQPVVEKTTKNKTIPKIKKQPTTVIDKKSPPIHPAAPLSDPFSEEIDQIISSLAVGATHSFSPSLSSAARRAVHALSEQNGLLHGSSGEGKERYIWVKRPEQPKEHMQPQDKQPKRFPSKSTPNRAPAVVVPQVAPAVVVPQPAPKDPSKCAHDGCGMGVKVIGLDCRFCGKLFCVAHAQAEVHGCGDTACRTARKEVRNPDNKKPVPCGPTQAQLRKKLDAKLSDLKTQRRVAKKKD